MAAKPPRISEKKGRIADQPVNAPAVSVQDRIRIRAYELYQARNGGPGDPEDDWYRAEAEVRAKTAETSE